MTTLKQTLAVLNRKDERYLSGQAKNRKTNVEAIDLAYFAFGVYEAWKKYTGVLPEGQIEFVDQCLRYAPLLILPVPDDNSTVWCYEICEDFGAFVAKHILEHEHGDTDVFKAKLATWITEGCK